MEGLRIYYSADTNEWCAETVPKRMIMRDLEGSIFEMWKVASSMIKHGNSGPSFNFNKFEYESPDLSAFWHTSTKSYLISCSGGGIFKTEEHFVTDSEGEKYSVGEMRLIADPSAKVALERHELAENFVSQVNLLKVVFSGRHGQKN